jgi:hypothetical protein
MLVGGLAPELLSAGHQVVGARRGPRARGCLPSAAVRAPLACAKKCARRSARNAHELPSGEQAFARLERHSVQMLTNCRETKRAREDSNL